MTASCRAITAMALGAFVSISMLGFIPARAEQSAATETNFRYLPAVKSSRAVESLLLDIARADGRLVAVGERGFVVYSDDEGQSWAQADVPVSVTLTAVTFPTPLAGWAVGHEGTILNSTDGGASWSLQFTGEDVAKQEVGFARQIVERMEAEMETADEDALDDLEFELDEASFALEDAEAALESGGTTSPFLDVWFADESNGFAVGAYGLIFRTVDGGQNWSIWSHNLDNLDKYHYYSLVSPDGATLYLSGEAGTLFRSGDAGLSWDRLESPYEGSLFGILALPNGGGDRIMSFGLRGNIFISDDRGDNWDELFSENENTLMGGAVTNGRLVIVGRSGTVLSSDNGGDEFTMIIREDRGSYSAVLPTRDGNLVLVGEGGIHLATADGSAR